jgi:uncharacterized protein YoxC
MANLSVLAAAIVLIGLFLHTVLNTTKKSLENIGITQSATVHQGLLYVKNTGIMVAKFEDIQQDYMKKDK